MGKCSMFDQIANQPMTNFGQIVVVWKPNLSLIGSLGAKPSHLMMSLDVKRVFSLKYNTKMNKYNTNNEQIQCKNEQIH